MRYFIGIDGGGTKTEGVLVDENGNVIKRELLGAANPKDIGIGGTCALVEQILNKLTDGLCENELYAFAGIAGALDCRNEIRERLSRAFPRIKIGVDSDIVAFLSCECTDGADCAGIICGTGSVCFVRKGNEYHRIGGWGYLLDGGGSGYDIGRDVIDAVLRAYDGRGEATVLSELFCERTGKNAEDAISEIYDGGKAYIASFAGLAFEADARGDCVAAAILEKNAYYIGEYLTRASQILGDGFVAIFSGGICTHFTDRWLSLVRRSTLADVKLRLATSPQVLGDVVEAMRLANVSPDGRTVLNIEQTYTSF